MVPVDLQMPPAGNPYDRLRVHRVSSARQKSNQRQGERANVGEWLKPAPKLLKYNDFPRAYLDKLSFPNWQMPQFDSSSTALIGAI